MNRRIRFREGERRNFDVEMFFVGGHHLIRSPHRAERSRQRTP